MCNKKALRQRMEAHASRRRARERKRLAAYKDGRGSQRRALLMEAR